ncbi:MAG: hypothetical protein OXH86_15835 [Acidimicrobiaceae bacterium]|nr:hypothetical protein [Acidimicrobiaceae bacterium]
MSEEDRSRLYAWLREQTDEPLAEYLMSCLPAAPLSDLLTKQHLEAVLSAKFSEFALELAGQREADGKESSAQFAALAAQREADGKAISAQFALLAAQREADRKEAAAQREADREVASKRHRLLVGAAIVLAVEIVAAEAGWLRWFTDLLATAF